MEEIAMYILDIVNNSIRAGSNNIHVFIKDSVKENIVHVMIVDDGCGMNETQLNKVTDPFYTSRTTRNVGLGVPMFKDSVEMSGGTFNIQSLENDGTLIEGTYIKDHLDTPPMGDIIETMITLIQFDENINYIFEYNEDDHEFVLNTIDIKEILEDVPINIPEVLNWLREYIKEGLRK